MKRKLHWLLFIFFISILTAEAYTEDERIKIDLEPNTELLEGAIEAFILVDAESGEDLYVLEDGAAIDIESIKDRKLSIRLKTIFSEDPANMPFITDIEIDFKLEGPVHDTRTEHVVPYAVFGDINGDYNGKTFPEGNYTIWAGVDDSPGDIHYWDTRKISFSVGKVAHKISGFYFINAEGNFISHQIKSGDVLNFSDNPMSFEARAGSYKIGSVVLELSGPVNYSATENVVPFTLFGDSGGQFDGQTLPEGFYTLTATPYSEPYEKGKAGSPQTINFSIAFNKSSFALSFYTDMVDAATGNSLERIFINDRKVIDKNSISTDNINFIVYPLVPAIGSVYMALVGPVDSFEKFVAPSHIQRENIIPYAMFGDIDGNLNGKSLVPGLYRIYATPYTGKNGTGNAGFGEIYEFEITDTSTFLKAPVTDQRIGDILVYPNPSNGNAVVAATDTSIIEKTIIYDIFGKKVKEYSNKRNSEQSIDLSDLPKGMYVVQINTGKEQVTKKLVIQ